MKKKARARAALLALRRGQRRIGARVERRCPALYDARHAMGAIGRALWPLIGPLLTALFLLPIVALIAGLVALFDIQPPSVDLPSVPLPEVTVPAWLRAIGRAVASAFSVLADVVKVLFIPLVIALGIYETVVARRRRVEAERLGRSEALRRLAAALGRVQAVAIERHVDRLEDICKQNKAPERRAV
ncbi:MAG: hypothetical protein M3116_02995 [Actinomycetota bacterium]|nr:hypothetical protein [Actinomycetota bacterium]